MIALIACNDQYSGGLTYISVRLTKYATSYGKTALFLLCISYCLCSPWPSLCRSSLCVVGVGFGFRSVDLNVSVCRTVKERDYSDRTRDHVLIRVEDIYLVLSFHLSGTRCLLQVPPQQNVAQR